MCKFQFALFIGCGHRGENHYRICESPSISCGDVEVPACTLLAKAVCPTYFMLADPRTTPGYVANSSSSTRFTDERREEAQKVWQRAEEHLNSNTTDILEFVGTDFTPLSKWSGDAAAFYKIYDFLIDDFWWRLEHPETLQLTDSQKVLILQLQIRLEIGMLRWLYLRIVLDDRIDAVKGLTNVSITEENPDCSICREPFGVAANTDAESPVKLSCGHVFGRICIVRWLDDGGSCPMCREIIAPLEDHIDAEQAILDEWIECRGLEEDAAMERGPPAWLFMLTGCNTAEYCRVSGVEMQPESQSGLQYLIQMLSSPNLWFS